MKNPEQRDFHAQNIFMITAGILTAAIGLLVLLGWILQFSSLTSFGTNLIPMSPSTALLFILIGSAFAIHIGMPQNRRAYVACLFVGTFVAISSFALFFCSSCGIYPGIERLGFSNVDSSHGMSIGYMSPLTAIFFLAGAGAFLLMVSRSAERPMRAVFASVLSLLLIITSSIF